MRMQMLPLVVLLLIAPLAGDLLYGEDTEGWRVSLEQRVGYPCTRVHSGQRYVYLFIPCPRRYWKEHPLVVQDQRPVLNETTSRYDVDTLITCVDGYTGKLLWTRRLAGWNFGVAMNESDDLFTWREAVFRFDAKTGELKEQRQLPGRKQVEAMWLNGQISFERLRAADGRYPDGVIIAYNWTTNRVRKYPAQRTFFMAPDESVYLTRRYASSQTILSAQSVSDDKVVWEFRSPGSAANDPIWEDEDVIFLSADDVIRLDGGTGQVKWRTKVPGKSFYPPANSVRAATSYLPSEINGLQRWKDYLVALSSDGRLLMLNPKNGKVLRQIRVEMPLLGFPRMIKNRLVVAAPTAVTATPVEED